MTQFWKPYRTILLVLVITVVLILPCLMYFDTWLHERAHVKAMEKVGLAGDINMNVKDVFLYNIFGEHSLGTTLFAPASFNALSTEQRATILRAGIVSDIKLCIVLLVLLIVINISLWSAKSLGLLKSWHILNAFLWSNTILILWLMALLWAMHANMTVPGSDIMLLGQLT